MPDFQYDYVITVPCKEGLFSACLLDEPYFSLLQQHGDNFHNVAQVIIYWVALLADSPATSSQKPRRIFRQWTFRLCTDFLGEVKNAAGLYDALTKSLRRNSSNEVTIDQFVQAFKQTPIFWEYHKYLLEKSGVVFKFLSTFLTFGKKSYYKDSDFEATAFREWLEVEHRLGGLQLDENITEDLRCIISWILEDIDDSVFLAKHGNGAVAEKGIRSTLDKHRFIDASFLDNLLPADDNICTPVPLLSGDLKSQLFTYRTARLKFVPKDVGKARSICMEPTVLQWAQQAIRLWLENALARKLGEHIQLHDQGLNREQARAGSINGLSDTIDLKNASDSNAWELILRTFDEPVLGYLEVTRSRSVIVPKLPGYEDIGKTIVDIYKYAPMGSALCFPVQCLVYAAVVIRSHVLHHLGADVTSRVIESPTIAEYYERSLSTRYEKYCVYGDDIICDHKITDHVISTLKLLGFVVNEGKSFTGDSPFRESCGGFYLNGFDVTPLRAKFKQLGSSITITTLSGLTDLANLAYDYGYLTLRKHIINTCLYTPIAGVRYRDDEKSNPILFSCDLRDTLSIYSENPRNTHLKRRYNRDLQRTEVKSVTARSIRHLPKEGGHLDKLLHHKYDELEHMSWWNSKYTSTHVDDVTTPMPCAAGRVVRGFPKSPNNIIAQLRSLGLKDVENSSPKSFDLRAADTRVDWRWTRRPF